MSISFNNPQALFLLLLLPLVFVIARAGAIRAAIRKRNRNISIGLRLLIVTLLVLSIADTQLITQSDKLATVFLIDVSDSVGTSGKDQAVDFTRQALDKMKDNQESGVVVFGQEALIEKLVNKSKILTSIDSAPGTNYSNLADAVRLGTSMLPSDTQRRLVLLSDGNQNLDEVRSAAKIAAANGVQIDIVPISRAEGPEISLSNINVPSNLREGEEFSINVAVESNFEGGARLLILQGSNVVSDNQVQVKVGTNNFVQPLRATSKGFVNYTARIIPNGGQDTLEQNNEANAFSVVKGKPKVLLVDGHPQQNEAANLSNALKAAEIDTVTIAGEKFPGLTELAQYDSVIIINVPATSLPPNSMNVLQQYVKDLGKGMVMVGGDESYGLGGYFRTPMEELLPVELQLPTRLSTPSVAMVLVVDRSGSMADSYNGSGAGAGGIPKMELAKDAAFLAVGQLSNTDQVGVVTFDTTAQWQVPLGPMVNPANFVGPIGRISPGGGTNIYSGFAPAVEALEAAKAQNKHIILMTDGQDSEGLNYRPLIDRANKAGITVSTVGLGEDVNTNLLKMIADNASGRYYFVNDPNNLPKIFTRESRLAARSYIIEEPFTPQIAMPSPILKNLTATPQLKGYVGTKAKPTATLALVTERNEPLLVHWQNGLGRVVAWTSDAKGKWASNWLAWDNFPRFWAQVVRWTIAENDTGGLQVQTRVVGNRLRIEADALSTDSQFLNGLEAKAKIVSSGTNGAVEEVTLQQTAPGHYEGYFIPKTTGSYIVSVQANGTTGTTVSNGTGSATPVGTLSQTVGAVASYSPEYKQLGTNNALLQEVASLTGGQVLAKPEQAFENNVSRTTSNTPMWPWFLVLALLLFPLDVGVRRINLSFKAFKRGFQNRGTDSLSPEQGAAIAGGSQVNRLFQAKERAVSGNRLSSINNAPKSNYTVNPTYVPEKKPDSRLWWGGPFTADKVTVNTTEAPTIQPATPTPIGLAGNKAEPEEQKSVAKKAEAEEETTFGQLAKKIHRSGETETISGDEVSNPANTPGLPVQPFVAPVRNAPTTQLGGAEAEDRYGLTGRLLRAKQRVHEDRKKPEAENKGEETGEKKEED